MHQMPNKESYGQNNIEETHEENMTFKLLGCIVPKVIGRLQHFSAIQ